MKAILVIDMPSKCGECPLAYRDMLGVVCELNDDGYVKEWKKPNWCPLRPLPKKNEIKNEEEFMNVCGWMYEVQTGMDIGWNDCLDEIMGEEK